MKAVRLGLVGLSLVSSLFAIEDGNYDCVSTEFSKDGKIIKIPEKEYSYANIKVFNKGASVTDGSEECSYYTTNKKVGMDFYISKKLTIGLPKDDVGNGYFRVAAVAKSNDKNDKIVMLFVCRKHGVVTKSKLK